MYTLCLHICCISPPSARSCGRHIWKPLTWETQAVITTNFSHKLYLAPYGGLDAAMGTAGAAAPAPGAEKSCSCRSSSRRSRPSRKGKRGRRVPCGGRATRTAPPSQMCSESGKDGASFKVGEKSYRYTNYSIVDPQSFDNLFTH